MQKIDIAAGIPEKMAKAILAAQNDMPSLRKGDENKYGGYAYVSIDDYLSEIPKVAAVHGLFWITRETRFEVIGEKGNHVAYTFALDLMFEDGTCLPEYTTITVVHPIQGAQTAGSALAYGEKMMTRFVFKVVTGEQDADATDGAKEGLGSVPRAKATHSRDGRPHDPTPLSMAEAREKGLIPKQDRAAIDKPAEVVGGIADGGIKVTEEDGVPVVGLPRAGASWSDAAEVFSTFVGQCNSAKDLTDFWDTNISTLDKMKDTDGATYKKVKKAFSARKIAIDAPKETA